MKKRIFSWLMALAMVMSMIPGAAFATTEGQPAGDAPTTSDTAAVTNEAKIGDMEYATLAGAIKAAQNGETVEILADHEISEPVLVEKDLTLDLGGAIIAGKDVYPVFRIQSGATVTVKNGTVTNEDYIFVLGASDGSSAGNLTIESGTYHGDTTVASVTKGTLVVEGGEFSVEPYEGSYNYLLNCIDANYKSGTAKIEVKGGIFHNFNPANNAAELTVPTNFLGEGFVAIQSGDIWTVEDNRVAQIGENKYATLAKAVEEGGEITLLKDVQLDAAIEVANTVAIDLDGHSISMSGNDTFGDGVFHVIAGGTLTINGEGTVNSVGNNIYSMAIWADGGDVVINGGTYTNVGAGEDTHYDLIYAKNGGTVTINGGTFECQTPAWTLNLKDGSDSTIVVKGGTFEGFNPAEAYTEPTPERPFSYVPAGYHVQESDGSYTVCSNADIVGKEVTLDGDITVTSGGIVVDKDTTVNLGGYTISAPADTSGDGVFHVTGGTLTINGEGTINGVGNNIYSMAIWADGGDVVINGGTYTNVGAGEDTHYDLIYAKNGGTVTINGGTFECQTPAWTLNLKDGSDSTIVVKGGTFKGFDPANGTTENPAVSFVAVGHVSELSGETYVVSPVTYTVTFMDGQNELEQKGINHGVAITKPADPTKDGYAFAGWYTDTALTSAYDFSTAVTGNVTLYAKWTENSVVPPSTPETDDDDDDYTPVRPSNPTVDKEVTENADGSTTITETKKDGTVIETTKSTDGSTGTTTVDPDGTVTAEVKISSYAVDEADEEEIPVTLPIAPISVTDDTETAATVTIRVPAKVKSVTVEIPVEDVTPGTVVVLVDKDGNETVVNTTGITENGVVIQIEGNVTVKVVENSKDFQDVSNRDWYSDAADFVSSRGLMNGMTEDTFGHNVPTSRAMVAQILHNMEGKPGHTYTGSFEDVGASDWYGDAIHWAAEEGIISGTGNDNFAPNAYVTREQLAVMMWKYAGAEYSNYSIGAFKDYGEISSYAEMALRWAVENGLMSGKGNGQLDPKGNATRAEVASVLMKFYENVKY